MLNPFLQPFQPDKTKRQKNRFDETTAQIYGHSLDTASPRPSVGLWVGKLLIRMGEKLSGQESESKELQEHS